MQTASLHTPRELLRTLQEIRVIPLSRTPFRSVQELRLRLNRQRDECLQLAFQKYYQILSHPFGLRPNIRPPREAALQEARGEAIYDLRGILRVRDWLRYPNLCYLIGKATVYLRLLRSFLLRFQRRVRTFNNRFPSEDTLQNLIIRGMSLAQISNLRLANMF